VSLHWERLCATAAAEIDATLEDLPAPLRERAARLPVTFEPRPNAGLQADGIAPDTLGLFTGAEFVEQESSALPPQIILFLENIWEFADTEKKGFCDEVHTTFLHELGHYLGLDEDGLTERGLE
jgi:predicted Zn-dependent protease with MMP-like domain